MGAFCRCAGSTSGLRIARSEVARMLLRQCGDPFAVELE